MSHIPHCFNRTVFIELCGNNIFFIELFILLCCEGSWRALHASLISSFCELFKTQSSLQAVIVVNNGTITHVVEYILWSYISLV